MKVGDLVMLKYDVTADSENGVPAHTLGIVVGLAQGAPQVALAGCGIKTLPAHVLESVKSASPHDEFIGIIAALLEENAALTRRLAQAVTHRPAFGAS